ncbi:polysaccharide deacetylase family protein [Rhodococcus sp. BP-149]|uniref:polysaccharide deacetylase family protein n=1 Tax=unclassified Rhodococcus (in: high G+C Gram-positive bacteria) TaxID=192944 RepID=UPI001C9AC545|nr:MULTISPECIES: polysaccharide deacetylase family protein [unclassified Rhodococcus (in: high G+C Gram-positive bacteria)]MBY6687749.1 polysaccharide deacetylase family protein [Rhodococcus sp. BP-288]MBY6696014.1 polysaccharide deacetylase family protein [Rhodococcus sp. BP-188]MBY6700611.1 polysaccharide deacetylase family protein [Rhodococcus sp. BP-285]MBY6705008.1 polysaccharide deacetylase family protein [Rhodococcus sp. BP-283]MBY6708578.1 polysaccharide deacetylase family protein [Rho
MTVDNLGRAAEITLGLASRPDPHEPGIRALPRVLDLFERLGITATFFVEGWNGLHHPEAVHSIAERGHEVGLHGWMHENWDELTDGQRESRLFDGTAALGLAGVEPIGFRAPGGYRGSRTAEVLCELGYAFDASIDRGTEGDFPSVSMLSPGIPSVPFRWDMIDFWQYHMHPAGPRSPAQYLDHLDHTLDVAIAEGGLLTLVVHPFESFADEAKLAVVTSFLERATASPDVDVLSAGTVAARAAAQLAPSI